MSDYKYTIITRENSVECDFSLQFWENHPDWNYYVRTNHRSPGNARVWLGGGGDTLEEAITSAEGSLRALVFLERDLEWRGEILLVTPRKLTGEESPTIIRNELEGAVI